MLPVEYTEAVLSVPAASHRSHFVANIITPDENPGGHCSHSKGTY